MRRERIERLDAEAMFVREMEDAPPVDLLEALHFNHERSPLIRRETEKLLRRPSEDLRQLEDQKCALLFGRGTR